MANTKARLTDAAVEKLPPNAGIMRDEKLGGFFVVVGRRRKTFRYQRDTRDANGKRITESIKLGVFGTVSAAEARLKVLRMMGKDPNEGEFSLRQPDSIVLGKAVASYCEDMRARGGSEKWIRECERNYKRYLERDWGNTSLRELSGRPTEVRDWHKKIREAHGPSAANHAGRLLRQTYRNVAATIEPTLPTNNPTSAIRWAEEANAQTAIPFREFPKWAAQVDAVEKDAPLRAAFHRLCVLTGLRPGSLARLKPGQLDFKSKVIRLGKFKTKIEVIVPMSGPIIAQLRLALADAKVVHEQRAREWVFPSIKSKSGHLENWLFDEVDYCGHAGRHTHRTVAADLGIDELTIHLLQGHSTKNISQAYITKAVLAEGFSLPAAQRRISERIMQLMRGKAKAAQARHPHS